MLSGKCCVAAMLTLGLTAAADVTVGTATSMERVFPCGESVVKPAESCAVRLARREKESFQLLVTCSNSDLRDVKVSCSDLSRKRDWWAFWDAETLKADNIACDVVGYAWVTFPTSRYCMTTHYTEKTNDAPGYRQKSKRCTDAWYPDPILDFLDGIEIKKGTVQSFWIRVRCPADQKAGEYEGALSVRGVTATDGKPFGKKLPFTVRVNGFEVPKASPLPLAVTFGPMAHYTNTSNEAHAEAKRKAADPEGPVMLVKGRIPEWGDFLADYYLTMDSLYTRTNLHWEVLTKLRDEGRLGCFNLGYWSYFKNGKNAEAEWRASTLPRLRRNYEKAKELGILDKAYLYGCDEVNTNFFENIRTCVNILKKEFPGVPISTTAYDHEFGVGTRLDVMDWFTPLTPRFDKAKAEKSRAAGHQVWWYICCGPGGTWANGFTQFPPIDLRMLMGAQTVRMRPDGFLYYEISIWNAERPISNGPFTDWVTRSFMTLNGDGCWTAVGPGGKPLATLRLENFRDGLEDYAYALLLEKKLAANPDAPWAAEAKALLDVPKNVMNTMNDFNDDPAALYAWRNAMADLIDRP